MQDTFPAWSQFTQLTEDLFRPYWVLYCLGVILIRLRNWAVKALWSQKPNSNPISTRAFSVSRRSLQAFSIFTLTWNCWGDNPVASLNLRFNCRWDRPIFFANWGMETGLYLSFLSSFARISTFESRLTVRLDFSYLWTVPMIPKTFPVGSRTGNLLVWYQAGIPCWLRKSSTKPIRGCSLWIMVSSSFLNLRARGSGKSSKSSFPISSTSDWRPNLRKKYGLANIKRKLISLTKNEIPSNASSISRKLVDGWIFSRNNFCSLENFEFCTWRTFNKKRRSQPILFAKKMIKYDIQPHVSTPVRIQTCLQKPENPGRCPFFNGLSRRVSIREWWKENGLSCLKHKHWLR